MKWSRLWSASDAIRRVSINAVFTFALATVVQFACSAVPSARDVSVVLAEVAAPGGDGDCADRIDAILAGSSLYFVISAYLMPTEANADPFLRLDPGWPAYVEIEFSWAGGKNFSSDPILQQRFRLRPFFSRQQLKDDSLRALGQLDSSHWSSFREFQFAAVVPPELAGKTVYARAYYTTSEFGRKHSNYDRVYHMVAPCSREDTLQILGSRVRMAYRTSDFAEGIALGDSLVEVGMIGTLGLQFARYCASQVGDYDRSIFYLDTLYRATGKTEWAPTGWRTPAQWQEEYISIRSHLLEDAAGGPR